jgi:hypothetical protein
MEALVGAPVDPHSLQNVLEEFKSIQDRLNRLERSINDVREFAVHRAGESEEDRLSRVFKLLASIDLTAGAIDTGLEGLVDLLSKIQADARQLKARTDTYLLLTILGGYVILAWIAAGQVALCLCGWRNWCRSRRSLSP